MNKLADVRLRGLSGKRYKFAVYPLDTVFDEAFSGVYVVTRRRRRKSRKGFGHRRICAGESAAIRQLPASVGPSLSVRDANCICVHAEGDEAARRRIAQDLAPRPPGDDR